MKTYVKQFIKKSLSANNVFKKDLGEKCAQASLDLPAGAQTVRLGGNHGLHISRTVRGEHWSFFQSLFRSQPLFQVEVANLENFLKAAKDLEIKGLQVRSKTDRQ